MQQMHGGCRGWGVEEYGQTYTLGIILYMFCILLGVVQNCQHFPLQTKQM